MIKSERDKTFWNMSNGYLTSNEVMKIINEIGDWCAHRALTHSDIRGYSDNDITPGEASDSIREITTCLEDLSYRLDEYNMADDEDIQNGDFDDLLPMIDDAENLCKKLLTEETYSRMYNDIFKDLELVGNRDFELNSSREIASAKYDSDTSNLRAMKIPEDLPTWIFEKYVDETNQHNKEWVWYYFLEAIKHNPWKSGFTGDSLYATDGNIDIVVGPQQARCRLYKVTPKSQSMTELPYAAGGKKDDFYDWYIDKQYVDAFIKDVLHNYIWSRIKSSRKQIVSSKKQIESKLNFDKITDMCDDLDFSTLGYGRDSHGDMIAELDAIEGESGNIEGVEIRFTENDDGQTVIAVYKKDHKVDTMTAKLVDGEISKDDINEAIYDFLEENSQMLNSSRKISSVRVNELTEQEKDDLYEIEKNEAEEHYNSLDDSDKQMLKARYGIKNVKDYVEFFIVHPNKLSDDYEFMNDPRIKLNSHRPVKSGLDKETVSVDVNSLYHFLTDSETAEVEGDFALVRCDKDDGETYYDILSDGDLACLDGETCEIVGKGEGFVELHSVEADDGVNFKLSPEEFEVACGKSKKEIKSSLTSDSFEMMVKDSRKMAEDMNSKLEDWWVTKQVGQDVVYFVAEHKDYSVRVRFEFVDSGFCYVSKTYTNGSYYEPVVLESWKYEGLSAQEIESKILNVLNDFFPKYNEIGSSKKPVESSLDYEPLTKLLDDLSAYPESRMPPAGIYKRLLDWKVGSEGMDETEARKKFGTFTVGEWIDDLKESMM